jgi:Ca-activated chloride channel family protein
MSNGASLRGVLFLLLPLFFLAAGLSAQVLNLPVGVGGSNIVSTSFAGMGMDQNLWLLNGQARSPLESPNGSLSKLDLKAPGKARREYEKGYQLLMRKDLQGAVQHLTLATSIYASFVAAHNALGSAYLSLGQNDQAREEFAQAVALDDHLPGSYLNLGCAELALSHFPAAQEAMQKASTIAPLDLSLLSALAYGQFMNHDYAGAVATAHQVHERKHEGAAMVHFFAAAALGAQERLPQAQQELLTLLREDPKSPAAAQAVQIIEDLKREQMRPATKELGVKISYTMVPSEPTGPVELPERIRKLLQDAKENGQIAEAEAAAACPSCAAPESSAPGEAVPGTVPRPGVSPASYAGFTLHASTDEVAVFFAATDRGKSVTDLTGKDVELRDKGDRPARVTGFRSESELPLRLGLVIDTSASVKERFKFEQEAASNFMEKVVTGRDDLAFVIGFANSVLLVQDFTGDQKLISHAVGQLVPSGGTALWDAVAFAADKLAHRREAQPVARVLVVISDGEDNSSSGTLQQAISRAQRGEVAIYTVSTREAIASPEDDRLVGEHALTTLAELTGGTDFSPGSVRRLDSGLVKLEQVIRSRYLISYKPAAFKRDGQYHAIDIQVEKDGHKLRVYARKGYFAKVSSPGADHF